MKACITIITFYIFGGSISFESKAQIPVEVFGGHTRTTIDIMFFKFFKNKQKENSPFLFFNRNRASIDYRMTDSTYLPQFGFTEAVSYNHPKLVGFAPVVVAQFLNLNIFPKAGIQYAFIRSNMTVFSWVTCETMARPSLDVFLLARYTPKLYKSLHLFTQLESVNSIPTHASRNYSFTERLRLGLKIHDWQFGAAADLFQAGQQNIVFSMNLGGFLRHEF